MPDLSTRSSGRRALLQRGLLLGALTWTGGSLAACTPDDPTPGSPLPNPSPSPTGEAVTPRSTPAPSASPTSTRTSTRTSTPTGRTLLAYFSRAGENYYYGGRRDLEVGNTEVLARLIAEITSCDLYRIEAADPYPDGYDATVARNTDEQDADARPAIVDPPGSIGAYDTVLLASPVWNVRPPMIMTTFAETYDFRGTTVHPVVTYAVSGLGRVAQDYAAACRGARIGAGLAIRGEEVPGRRAEVETWLRRQGLLT
jgi:hypothetical protein